MTDEPYFNLGKFETLVDRRAVAVARQFAVVSILQPNQKCPENDGGGGGQ